MFSMYRDPGMGLYVYGMPIVQLNGRKNKINLTYNKEEISQQPILLKKMMMSCE